MLDFLQYRFSLLTLTLSITVGVIVVFQLLHYIIVYGRILFYNKKKTDTESVNYEQGVSIVLVANNNAEALQNQLLKILEQDYPEFEVVIVNENSQDDTEFVIYVLSQMYPNIKLVNLKRNLNKFSDRKFSLSLGIRSATYNTIVLTDIICDVKDFDWLKSLVAPLQDGNKKIVMGYCGLTAKKGMLNQISQYYYATKTMDSFGMAILGFPYTADGKNITYDKNFFFAKDGLITQYTENCKQEDYFVNRHATARNTIVNLNNKSFIYRPAYADYKTFKRDVYADFLSRRTFSFGDKIRLSLLPISSFLLYALLIFLIIIGFPWQYCLIPIVLKWIPQIIYYNKCMKRLEIKSCWFFSPLYEVYFIFLNFFMRVKKVFTIKKKHKIKWA
ncbi:MAG: glycosyltransferase family 2 protein [Bacteroidales bacterium]|nr:glycosyltransferase family 2 protein [Bacteroidales bacterium]